MTDTRTWEIDVNDPAPPEGTRIYAVQQGSPPSSHKVGYLVPRRYQFDYVYRLWEDVTQLPNGFCTPDAYNCIPNTSDCVKNVVVSCTCPVISQLSLYDDLHSEDCAYGKSVRAKVSG